MKLFTVDTKKKKSVFVGNILGDTLYKEVENKHLMRVVEGYGIQENTMRTLHEKGVRRIIIKNIETGKELSSSLDAWNINGRVADYGHGKQRFLSLKYMGDCSISTLF